QPRARGRNQPRPSGQSGWCRTRTPRERTTTCPDISGSSAGGRARTGHTSAARTRNTARPMKAGRQAMTDPHGLDQMLTFVYDDGPASSTPIVPRPESGPRRRWPQPRWPLLRRRWRIGDTWRALRRTHPFGRLGDFLLFLTAADSEKVGSRSERYRYGGVGLLMLVTSAQAFYAATLFASVSLGKSFRAEAGYGIFFAAAVYFIDRSIISFASPIRKDEKGTLAAPKKASWVLGLRVVIAVAAALLMSEMVLLQVFAGDITEQIQIDHIAAEKVAGSGIAANYQARIGTLQGQIDAAQGVVSKRQDDVNNAYH